MIDYRSAPDIDSKLADISRKLRMEHVDMSRVIAIRSFGSKSRYVLARCHTLPRIVQTAFKVPAHYLIEIVSENFDKLDPEEQTKTLIHELMHIPKTFGGGFRHHRPHVNKRTVDRMYREYLNNTSE